MKSQLESITYIKIFRIKIGIEKKVYFKRRKIKHFWLLKISQILQYFFNFNQLASCRQYLDDISTNVFSTRHSARTGYREQH